MMKKLGLLSPERAFVIVPEDSCHSLREAKESPEWPEWEKKAIKPS
jgi:hypothetical protein